MIILIIRHIFILDPTMHYHPLPSNRPLLYVKGNNFRVFELRLTFIVKISYSKYEITYTCLPQIQQ